VNGGESVKRALSKGKAGLVFGASGCLGGEDDEGDQGGEGAQAAEDYGAGGFGAGGGDAGAVALRSDRTLMPMNRPISDKGGQATRPTIESMKALLARPWYSVCWRLPKSAGRRWRVRTARSPAGPARARRARVSGRRRRGNRKWCSPDSPPTVGVVRDLAGRAAHHLLAGLEREAAVRQVLPTSSPAAGWTPAGAATDGTGVLVTGSASMETRSSSLCMGVAPSPKAGRAAVRAAEPGGGRRGRRRGRRRSR